MTRNQAELDGRSHQENLLPGPMKLGRMAFLSDGLPLHIESSQAKYVKLSTPQLAIHSIITRQSGISLLASAYPRATGTQMGPFSFLETISTHFELVSKRLRRAFISTKVLRP